MLKLSCLQGLNCLPLLFYVIKVVVPLLFFIDPSNLITRSFEAGITIHLHAS